MKKCSKCDEVKDNGSFTSSRTTKDGLFPWCRECKAVHRKARYLKHKDAEREQNRRWHLKNKPWTRPDKKQYINTWRRGTDRRSEAHQRRALMSGTWTVQEWSDLCNKYNNQCLSCGSLKLTVDHVVPLSRGGSNTIDNLQPLCQSCNSSKGTKIIDYRS